MRKKLLQVKDKTFQTPPRAKMFTRLLYLGLNVCVCEVVTLVMVAASSVANVQTMIYGWQIDM